MPLLSKVTPKAQAFELDAFLVPADWFFCRRVTIPSDLEKGEEEGFALLELESLSPFPLEHMYYGFRLDEQRRHAFVFAAYKRRFEGTGRPNWRRLDAVLPDFLLALHPKASDARPLILVTQRSFAAFRFDGESTLPCGFYAEPRPAEETEDGGALSAFRARVAERFAASSPRICYATTAPQWLGQSAWLTALDEGGAEYAKASFSRNELWKADLRDPDEISQAKRDERQNALLWKGALGIAALAALLVLGEAIWGGSVAYLALRKGWNEDRRPTVQAIDELQTTANALQSFQESNLAPFEMIAALLPYQNYPKVVYRKFETNGPDTLVIEARADNRTQVTEFKKRLEGSRLVRAVELSNQMDNPAGSTFTTTIRFAPGAFLDSVEVAGNE